MFFSYFSWDRRAGIKSGFVQPQVVLLNNMIILLIFTVRRYAKRGICCRRVSVCVCLSHSGIVSKRLNVGSCK